MRDSVRTQIKEEENKITFVYSSFKEKNNGKKSQIVGRLGQLVQQIFGFLLMFCIPVLFFYFTKGTFESYGLNILMVFFFLLSFVILYSIFSGDRGPVYNQTIAINKKEERVIIRDLLNDHEYSLSFGDFAAYRIKKVSKHDENKSFYYDISLILYNGVEIHLHSHSGNYHKKNHPEEQLKKIRSYLFLPVIDHKNNTGVKHTAIENKNYKIRPRTSTTVNKPAFNLFSDNDVEGIKFSAQKPFISKLILALFSVMFVTVLFVGFYDVLSKVMFNTFENYRVTIPFFFVLIFSSLFVLPFFLFTLVLIAHRLSGVQIAITDTELLLYKKWHLPILRKRFEKKQIIKRSEVKGIEIGRSIDGAFTLWLLSSNRFPTDLFNLHSKALGPPDLVNLRLGNEYKALSIWSAPLQENLGKTRLGDLVAARKFFQLSMPELPNQAIKA